MRSAECKKADGAKPVAPLSAESQEIPEATTRDTVKPQRESPMKPRRPNLHSRSPSRGPVPYPDSNALSIRDSDERASCFSSFSAAGLSVEPQENVRRFGAVGSYSLRAEEGEAAFLQDTDRAGVVFRHARVKRARLFQTLESKNRDPRENLSSAESGLECLKHSRHVKGIEQTGKFSIKFKKGLTRPNPLRISLNA